MRAMTLVMSVLLFGCGEKDDSAVGDDTSVGSDDSGDSGGDDTGRDSIEGRFEGVALFNIQDLNSEQTDRCEGEVVIQIDLSISDESLVGEFQCDFTGFLTPYSPMYGSVYGLVSESGEIAASYETGGGPIQGDWAGTVDTSSGVYGVFDGVGEAEGIELSWSGEFRAP